MILLLIWANLWLTGLPAEAGYAVALLSDGTASRTVATGEAFDLAIVLDSEVAVRHDSAVLRLAFSSSGLVLQDYVWTPPYRSGGGDDASVPSRGSLPVRVTAGTVVGTALPVDTVDVWWSNLTDTGDSFGSGRLLSLRLWVPEGYVGPERMIIAVAECTLAHGAVPILAETQAASFQLQIAPARGATQSGLAIERDGSNLRLSWPSLLADAVLETSDDATLSTWVRVKQEPSLVENRHVVTLVPKSCACAGYFRLRFR